MRRKLLGLLLALAVLTVFFGYGATFYPHPADLPSGDSLTAPSARHLLGTDNLGIDIYAQISVGFFRSLAIGLATAAVSFAVGGALGVLAGFLGGKMDGAVSFLINVFLSVPQLPIMIVIGAFFGQSTGNIIAIIAAFSWAPIAKQAAAKTRSIRRTGYVVLARSYGARPWYLIRRHMLRELLPLLLVTSLAVVGRAIIQESSLAFLGLSDPLAKSWGLMIARATAFKGIYLLPFWKWWILPPALALLASVVLLRLLSRRLEQHVLKEGFDG